MVIRQLTSGRHDPDVFEALEVGRNDEYLRLVLRVHGADILKHQPHLIRDGADGGRSAYLIQHGDETVGVVLVRDAGDGTAQIELDYVTPRFRDSPLVSSCGDGATFSRRRVSVGW